MHNIKTALLCASGMPPAVQTFDSGGGGGAFWVRPRGVAVQPPSGVVVSVDTGTNCDC